HAFELTPTVTSAGGPGFTTGVQLGDLNNDGSLDIVHSSVGAFKTEALLNDGTGHFTVSQSGFGPADGSDVQLGDLDGDGFLDIVLAASANDGGLQWWKNDGTGTFTF